MNDFIAAPIVHFSSQIINQTILFLFGVNILILIIILTRSRALKKIMDETRGPEVDRFNLNYPAETYLEKLRRNYDDWGRRYRDINPWVHYYSILTTIFPLLGILGTVCALLQVSDDFSQVRGGFLLALSSTFWGLSAAIASKAGEAVFSADIERFRVVYEIFTKDMIHIEKSDRDKLAAGPASEGPPAE